MSTNPDATLSYEWDRLEHAAEVTISAAAAAVLWSGGDEFGVLTSVAAATAKDMLQSRMVAEVLANRRPRRAFTPDEEHTFGTTPGYVLAALPTWLAPAWSATVAAALVEANRRSEQARYTSRFAAETTQLSALKTILQWTRDSVSPLRIELASVIAVSTPAWAPPAGA